MGLPVTDCLLANPKRVFLQVGGEGSQKKKKNDALPNGPPVENVHTSSVKAAVGLPPRVTLQSRSKVHKYDSLDSAQEQERTMEMNPQKSLPVVWVSKSPHRDGKNVHFVNGNTKPAPKAGTGTESNSVCFCSIFLDTTPLVSLEQKGFCRTRDRLLQPWRDGTSSGPNKTAHPPHCGHCFLLLP